MSTIKTYMNSFGQTIIGVLKEESPNTITLENAIVLGVQQDPTTGQAGLQIGPINPLAKDAGQGITVTFPKTSLIEFELRDDVMSTYERFIGKIEIAPASALATLAPSNRKQ